VDSLEDILLAVLEFVSAYVFNHIPLYEGYVIGSYEVSGLESSFPCSAYRLLVCRYVSCGIDVVPTCFIEVMESITMVLFLAFAVNKFTLKPRHCFSIRSS
jgi:hypothetical protein